MAEREGLRPPSSRDVAGEDFLFHLYRGSELLQDNRVHDAKAELEQALSLQPSDPKGQDLLGIVYFRLGLYPRAIAIYEQLIKLHPEAIGPRINLALSYLKTGQPAQARAELEKVVEQNPGHSRAWGYLGLAFQRLGDLERASYAFQAGGHEGMARRLVDLPPTGGSLRPEPPREELRHVTDDTLAASEQSGVSSEAASLPSPPSLVRLPWPSSVPAGPWSAIESGREGPASLRPQASEPRRAEQVARAALLLFPRDLPVSLHVSGVVLVQAAYGFITRLEAVRSMTSTSEQACAVLPRRIRGRPVDDPLGGEASPLCELSGRLELVLGAEGGQRLEAIMLEEDEALYLREAAITGFEPTVGYENGRLPVGDGDAMPMVQLRGPGAVVASFPRPVTSVEVEANRSTLVRGVSVVGWVGRLVPRAVVTSEAPGGMRGLVAFSGEGMVLLDDR